MVAAAGELTVEGYDAHGVQEHRDELLAVYAEMYVERLGDPFFSPERYWERVEAYASRDGFSLVTGRLDGQLIGYAMGFTLPDGSGWWHGFRRGRQSRAAA
jgi:hypothetical protein